MGEGVKTNTSFSDILTELGLGMANMPAHLALQVPQILEQLLAQQAGPVAGQMLAPLITQLYGGFLDSITGTSGADIRISDLMGAYTHRSLEQRILGRKARREYGVISSDTIESRTADVIASMYRAVYGTDEPVNTDSAGYRAIASLMNTARRQSISTAEGVLEFAAANGIQIAGVSLGTTGVESTAAKELAQQLSDHIDEMFYGVRGKASITGSLNAQEFRQVLTDAVRTGVIDGQKAYSDQKPAIEAYVAKIAQGIDNIKGAFGGNLSAAQARQLVTNLYGFDVYGLSADTFGGVAQDLNRLARATGISQEDLFGNEQAGKVGSLRILNQLAQGAGIAQHDQARLGVMLAAETKFQTSGRWGVDIQQQAGTRLIHDELSGFHQNIAVALTYWAGTKGLDPRNLTIDQLRDFEQSVSGIDLRDANAVNSYVKGAYNTYAGTDITQEVLNSNSAMIISASQAYRNRIREDMARDFITKITQNPPENLTPEQIAALGLDDLHSRSLGDIQARINGAQFLSGEQKQALIGELQSYASQLQSQNISWMRPVTDVAIRQRAANLGLTASGMDGAMQYWIANGSEATLQGAIRAYFGADYDSATEGERADVGRKLGELLGLPQESGTGTAEGGSGQSNAPTSGAAPTTPSDTTAPTEASQGEAPASGSTTEAQPAPTDWDEVSRKIGKALADELREVFNNIARILSRDCYKHRISRYASLCFSIINFI